MGDGEGVGEGGGGQGTFHPTCHLLHYHMVLRPKGTSHNETAHPHLSHLSAPVNGVAAQGTRPWVRPRSVASLLKHNTPSLREITTADDGRGESLSLIAVCVCAALIHLAADYGNAYTPPSTCAHASS